MRHEHLPATFRIAPLLPHKCSTPRQSIVAQLNAPAKDCTYIGDTHSTKAPSGFSGVRPRSRISNPPLALPQHTMALPCPRCPPPPSSNCCLIRFECECGNLGQPCIATTSFNLKLQSNTTSVKVTESHVAFLEGMCTAKTVSAETAQEC